MSRDTLAFMTCERTDRFRRALRWWNESVSHFREMSGPGALWVETPTNRHGEYGEPVGGLD